MLGLMGADASGPVGRRGLWHPGVQPQGDHFGSILTTNGSSQAGGTFLNAGIGGRISWLHICLPLTWPSQLDAGRVR